MTSDADQATSFTRKRRMLACAILLALPALLLFESLFLGQEYIPFDHRVFPPASSALSAEAIAELRQRGNWEITEKTMLVVPEFELAKQELEAGRLPHYNPWVRSGAPLFANVLDGFAHPLHLPLFFGRTEARFAIVAFMAFALAGLFMFGFLQSLQLSWVAALFGAIVFQLSGTLSANGHFYMRMETLAFLPAGFWALERYARSASMRAAVAFAAVLALTWLAGFPPFALVCSLAFGARMLTIVLGHAFSKRSLEGGLRAHAVKSAAVLGFATLLGLGLAAIQLVPMLDYFPEAQRNLSQSLDELASQGIDPLALFGVSMPFPFGSPIGVDNIPGARHPLLYQFWTRTSPSTGKLFSEISYNYTEYAIYLGAIPTVFAIVALFRGMRFRIFAAAALISAFVLATGGVVFQALADLPVIKSTPPMRFVGLCAFFGAALAAIGFEVIVHTGGKVTRRITEVVTAAAAALALGVSLWSRGLGDDKERATETAIEAIRTHWIADYPGVAGDANALRSMFGENAARAYAQFSESFIVLALTLLGLTFWMTALPYPQEASRARIRRALLGAVVGITAAFLMHNARHVNPSFPAPTPSEAQAYDENSVLQFLRNKRKEHAKDGGFAVARVADAPSLPIPLPPNTLMREHIRDLNSYAFVDARSHRPFLALYGPGQMIRQYWLHALPFDARLGRGLFDLVGVRYWLTKKAYPALGEAKHVHDEGGHGQCYVYENEGVLPRAWLVAKAKRAEGVDAEKADEAVRDRLHAEDFDPRRELWLHDVEAELAARGSDDADAVAKATVAFTTDESARLEIRVENSPGAWLVLSDAVYSNWHATIDGGETPWHRANLFCRAVWVPEGTHVVGFAYEARPFWLGLIASLVSALLCLVLFFWPTGRRAHAAPPTAPHESDPEQNSPDVREASDADAA